MTTRDRDARRAYLTAGKAARRDMINGAMCAPGYAGLYAGYQANDLANLARVRRAACQTRAQRLKRKADFFQVLARMAERRARLPLLP